MHQAKKPVYVTLRQAYNAGPSRPTLLRRRSALFRCTRWLRLPSVRGVARARFSLKGECPVESHSVPRITLGYTPSGSTRRTRQPLLGPGGNLSDHVRIAGAVFLLLLQVALLVPFISTAQENAPPNSSS